MRTIFNEKTKQNEVVFSAELIAPLSENTFENTNGKSFKIANVKFIDRAGKVQKSTALIYEGNYSKGMEVGQSYLAVASPGPDGRAYIRLSHLPYVDNRATIDMFSFDTAKETVKETSKLQAEAKRS